MESPDVILHIKPNDILKRNRRNRNRGKSHEKRTAAKFDAIRIGLFGGEDCVSQTQKLSIECKSVQRFVGDSWFQQATRNNKRANYIPIVVVHVAGEDSKKDYVLINVEDFLNILNTKEK